MIYVFYFGLYFLGITVGFLLIPCVIRRKENEKEGIELDDFYDKLFISTKFLEEVIEAAPSNLSQEELTQLKEKVLIYEIPYLKYKVIMYYDLEFEAFCYYSNMDIIYKYLDIFCRKYVLDFNCKQLYKFSEETKVIEKKKIEQNGPFVSKVERLMLEKDTNRFIYKGKLEDYDKKECTVSREITFHEFLVLQRENQENQSKETS